MFVTCDRRNVLQPKYLVGIVGFVQETVLSFSFYSRESFSNPEAVIEVCNHAGKIVDNPEVAEEHIGPFLHSYPSKCPQLQAYTPRRCTANTSVRMGKSRRT